MSLIDLSGVIFGATKWWTFTDYSLNSWWSKTSISVKTNSQNSSQTHQQVVGFLEVCSLRPTKYHHSLNFPKYLQKNSFHTQIWTLFAKWLLPLHQCPPKLRQFNMSQIPNGKKRFIQMGAKLHRQQTDGATPTHHRCRFLFFLYLTW